MQVGCQIKTDGFEAACLALAKVSGRSIQQVVEAELTAVLNKTIDYTKVAKVGRITANHVNAPFSQQSTSLYSPRSASGKRYRAKGVKLTKSGRILYNLTDFRYPAELWSAIQAKRKESLKKKLAAVGLARKSWWLIAQKLGLPVKGGRFTNAVAVTGKEYPENFSARKTVDDQGIAVAFINAQPTVNLPIVNGSGALQGAIDGRAKYFLANLQLGVLKSMREIARAYPGLKLTGVS